jgi:hypothetical protein
MKCLEHGAFDLAVPEPHDAQDAASNAISAREFRQCAQAFATR